MNLTLPKTFNNHVSFERGLWQRQSRQFEHVPKTAVFGTTRHKVSLAETVEKYHFLAKKPLR